MRTDAPAPRRKYPYTNGKVMLMARLNIIMITFLYPFRSSFEARQLLTPWPIVALLCPYPFSRPNFPGI